VAPSSTVPCEARSAAPMAAVRAGRAVVTTGTLKCWDSAVVTAGMAAPAAVFGAALTAVVLLG
jgi:hypothetical protein